LDQLREILRQVWGYEDFRPLQAAAMRAAMENRDSLVVLPTGGGKSLCFQAPALAMSGMAVVISPLISLMKDQVDSLVDCGVRAACINSTLSAVEKRGIVDDIRQQRLKLLYLSPERLLTEQMLDFLAGVPLSFIAIDEAHCISEWGHDFRPEYRGLRLLNNRFPKIALHAYTATATPNVRDDIARELGLADPEIIIGSFDRPNLVYRVRRRTNLLQQACEVIDRHPSDSGIIYAISRAKVEELARELRAKGYAALPYHAGMPDDERRQNQEAFLNDRARIIVATVAFGMGIDKSDVRYVIHAAAPKSLESYQQESGRAGRDGLEAECWLFYSAGDFQTWRRLQRELPPRALSIAHQLLAGIEGYASAVSCRHRALVSYFGQELEAPNCGACDVCLNEVDLVDEPLVVAQKILSCVVRVGEGYGGDYVAQVLVGSKEERVVSRGHNRLSTYGILASQDKKCVRGWIDQLVSQQFLTKTGEYNVLRLTNAGWQVLRGELAPRLLQPPRKMRGSSRAELQSWEGVDRNLFERLRDYRRRKSEERGVRPFVVFSDATLRDLARRRPSTVDGLLGVHGIGAKKCDQYGAELLREIAKYCRMSGAVMDADAATDSPTTR
jgi:ATP-dependent DNA helicase RecQ